MMSFKRDFLALSFMKDKASMSSMKDTALKSTEQLGITIRLKRRASGLSQSALAEALGVERKWVLRLEAGNPTAEVGLVLKALLTLRMRLSLSDDTRPGTRAQANSRLTQVFDRLKRPRDK